MLDKEAKERIVFMEKYSATFDDWEDWRLSTHCHCCDKSFTDKGDNSKTVDLNPETGKIKGIICKTCKNHIKEFKDHPERLVKIANYIRW